MSNYTASPARYEQMTYARCGRSGVLLPRVSLGLWHNFGDGMPYERSRTLTLAAFDHGITHFDLANNYGPPPGAAERRMGQLLRDELRGHRDELFLSTKAAYDMWEGPYGSWASRKHLMASLDQSLARLGVDYVDLFYCHRYDPLTPLDETLQALVDIVRAGKALYIGISRWPAEALRYAIDYLAQHGCPLLLYQGRWNMLDREVAESGVVAEVAEAEVGFISFSPLAQGLLTNRYLDGIPADSRMTEGRFLRQDMLSSALLARLRRLNAVALARGTTLAQMALAWILQRKEVTSVLIGVSREEQLLDNIGTLRCAPLSQEELRLIDDICSDTTQEN